MQPRTRIGLIVGVIGLAFNVCVAGLVGFCGPVLSLMAGGLAGFLAARQEQLPTKNEGARAGAMAGGIAGALIILGQIVGGGLSLFFMQYLGLPSILGQVPASSGDPISRISFYLGGIGSSLCIGLVGVLLAAGAGALAGYLGTTERPMRPPSGEFGR
jgi:hypothetical protein